MGNNSSSNSGHSRGERPSNPPRRPEMAPTPPSGYPGGLHPLYRPPPGSFYTYPASPWSANPQSVTSNGDWMLNGSVPPSTVSHWQGGGGGQAPAPAPSQMPYPYYPPQYSYQYRQAYPQIYPNALGSVAAMEEPQATVTIRNDVNVNKGSLEFKLDPEGGGAALLLCFSFDAKTDGSVEVFFMAKEGDDCGFSSAEPHIKFPPKTLFSKGHGQKFQQASGTGLDLTRFDERAITEVGPGEVYPIVIRLQSKPHNPPPQASTFGSEPPGFQLAPWVQSQMTYAVLKKLPDGQYVPSVIKQKIWVGGQKYEMKEIYGIENSGPPSSAAEGEDDSSADCVICLSNPRDTTVLPCRHMCMCRECAKRLRWQDNRCPICRQAVESVIEIRISHDAQEEEAKHYLQEKRESSSNEKVLSSFVME